MLILLLLAGRTVCSRQVKNSKWSKLADTRFNHSNHYTFKRQSCTFASSFLNFPAQVETYGDYSKCPKCEKNIKSTFIIRHIKVYSHIWNIFLPLFLIKLLFLQLHDLPSHEMKCPYESCATSFTRFVVDIYSLFFLFPNFYLMIYTICD